MVYVKCRNSASACIAALLVAGSAAAKDFLNIQPGYNLRDNCAVIRFEGSRSYGNLGLYGFIDMDSNSRDGLNAEKYFSKGRLTYGNKNMAVALERNDSAGSNDATALGLQVVGKTKPGITAKFRWFPVNTAKQPGMSFAFVEQDIGNAYASCFLSYNHGNSAYFEGEAGANFGGLTPFVQFRSGDPLGKMPVTSIAGVKIEF